MTIEKTGTYRDVRLSFCGRTLRLRWSGHGGRYSRAGWWILRWDEGKIISKHESRESGLVKARKILRGQP